MKKIILFFWGYLLCMNVCAAEHFEAHSSIITEDLRTKMRYSWKENNPVALADLRYITVFHWGFDGRVHSGELVVHKDLALEVIEIFKELFDNRFPIEKMVLIDAYQANDEASMQDNNTSAFCSRPITGMTDRFSLHSYGVAIDINPKINPYVKQGTVLPESGRAYLDRTQNIPGLINQESICYKAFKSRGWEWGGEWKSLQDYQHFEKEMPHLYIENEE